MHAQTYAHVCTFVCTHTHTHIPTFSLTHPNATATCTHAFRAGRLALDSLWWRPPLPGEDYLSHSASLSCLQLLVFEASWFPLSTLARLLLCFYLTRIWAVMLVDFMDVESDVTR